MLKYEDTLYNSLKGQQILKEYGNILEGSKIIQRMTLNNFGFLSGDENLAIYRKIFHHYYKNSTNYDKDILSSVYYMRENRLLYYTSPVINIGDKITDVNIYDDNIKSEVSLFDVLNKDLSKPIILASYSTS